MKIYIIHQYFKTPEDGGAIRSFYIARWLSAQGHEVEVITASNESRYVKRQIEGFSVHYLPVYYTNHLSFLSRIHAFYRFVRMAIRQLRAMPRADLHYVITTPLTTGLIATYGKKRLGVPYIFEVGDLWPDAPIQLGVIKNPLLKKLARKLEKISYQEAAGLVALSPDIQKELKKKTGRDIAVITNMADTTFFTPEAKQPDLLKKYNASNKFVVLYAGTVGKANQLEYLLDIASKDTSGKLQFIIAGGGARWTAVKADAEKRALSNVLFVDFVNKKGVKELMNVADAAYISFRNAPVLATGSPNKFFDALAAGKLIITNFQGWIGELIDSNKCGFSYDPGRPEEFFLKINPYVGNQEVLQEGQKNARMLAGEFSPEVQLKKLDEVIRGFRA